MDPSFAAPVGQDKCYVFLYVVRKDTFIFKKKLGEVWKDYAFVSSAPLIGTRGKVVGICQINVCQKFALDKYHKANVNIL